MTHTAPIGTHADWGPIRVSTVQREENIAGGRL